MITLTACACAEKLFLSTKFKSCELNLFQLTSMQKREFVSENVDDISNVISKFIPIMLL